MVTDPPHSGLPPGTTTSALSRAPLCRGLSKCSTSNAMRLLRSRVGSNPFLALYRGTDQVAPLGPRTVVVAHVVIAQEVGEHEPGVRGALPDPAVRYYVLPPAEAGLGLVDPPQLVGALEGPVFPDSPRPRHVRGPGNVPAPQSPLLRIIWHVQQLAAVLARTPHVHERPADIQVLLHVLPEGPDLRVIPLRHRVIGPGEGRHLLGHLAALGLPLDPSPVHDLDVVMAEEAEDPEGVGGPPVVPVPVEDDRGFWGDALLGHQVRKVIRVEVVAHEGVVEILDPVNLYGVRDVGYVVEEHVLVRLHNTKVVGIIQVIRHPLGADQGVWVRVALILYLLLGHVFSFQFPITQAHILTQIR